MVKCFALKSQVKEYSHDLNSSVFSRMVDSGNGSILMIGKPRIGVTKLQYTQGQ